MKIINEKIATPEITEIENLINDIYALRKTSLAMDGEYSTGNLIFKEFRNKGYLDNLKDLKNKLIGQELSLKEPENITKIEDAPETEIDDEIIEPKAEQENDAIALAERLNERQRRQYKNEISRIAFNQAIIQDNGLFNIYNVKEHDVDYVLNKLRRLDYVDWVNKTAGKFDFSAIAFGNAPQARYYNISGKIKDN